MNKSPLQGRIAKVIDPYHIAINIGACDGVQKGQKFLIYSIDDEPLIDPDWKSVL